MVFVSKPKPFWCTCYSNKFLVSWPCLILSFPSILSNFLSTCFSEFLHSTTWSLMIPRAAEVVETSGCTKRTGSLNTIDKYSVYTKNKCQSLMLFYTFPQPKNNYRSYPALHVQQCDTWPMPSYPRYSQYISSLKFYTIFFFHGSVYTLRHLYPLGHATSGLLYKSLSFSFVLLSSLIFLADLSYSFLFFLSLK